MGMAASQARYLALTARKTNTEYEGQQINQARTALANQSANLFNRLLTMEVPNPPKTTDYTKVQYSYSDGDNASVIDEWEQLSSADPNYNYIVTHYYYADIYTGSQKLLTNPEVTVKGVVSPTMELLNDGNRRFLAVTNVEIYPKNSNQPPKRYEFLELHMDSILMVHPISQTLFKEAGSTQNEDIARFRELRAKLNQTKPF